MTLRCPICKCFIRKGQPCRATRACERNAMREAIAAYAVDERTRIRSWAAAVRSRLRDMTAEQREGIRAWLDMLAEAPEGGEAECLRALDEVRP